MSKITLYTSVLHVSMYINFTLIFKSTYLTKPRILHIKRKNKEDEG